MGPQVLNQTVCLIMKTLVKQCLTTLEVSEFEFNKFEPRLKSPYKNRFLNERRLKYWKIEYDFKWNQSNLCRNLNLSHSSNSLNSASGYLTAEAHKQE